MIVCCSLCHLANRFEYWSEFCEFSEVPGGGGEEEFITCATGAAQAKASEPEDALQMGEEHLDFLAIAL